MLCQLKHSGLFDFSWNVINVCVIRNCAANQPIINSTRRESGKEQKTLRMKQGIFTKEEVTEAQLKTIKGVGIVLY